MCWNSDPALPVLAYREWTFHLVGNMLVVRGVDKRCFGFLAINEQEEHATGMSLKEREDI